MYLALGDESLTDLHRFRLSLIFVADHLGFISQSEYVVSECI